MFKAVSKVLVIALMLVAFVGQAITFNSSMPCENSMGSISSNVSEHVKHFGSNPIDTDNSVDTFSPEDCCGIDCCDIDCKCANNACSSCVYFNTEVHPTKTNALTEIVYMQYSYQPKSIATLLYRPPIRTS